MSIFFLNTNLQYFSLVFLIANFISFYFTKNKLFPAIFLIISLLMALITGIVGVLSIVIILLFGFLIYSFYQKKSSAKYKFLIFFSIFIITILSFVHLLPSFNNIEAIKNIRLSKNSSDLNLWLNFDKPLIAIFMLFFAYQTPRKLNDYKKIFLQTGKIFLPLSLVVIGIGMIVKFLVFDPKLPSFNITSLWLIKILFLTIFPEEFFFRFFLQNNIINLLKKSQFFKAKNYQIIGLIFTAIIFGLTHFSGGFSLVLLAIISGFGYGFVYMRTGYIESAILLHFLINLSHFLFFSYPFNLAIS
jgi:membrane protease YdiL (CAAX protease family)